jgi:hypothetical protein
MIVLNFSGFGGVYELPGRQKGDIKRLSPRGKPTMPYIKLRKQADGSLRYTAIVRIRLNGKMLHQETKTFTHRSAAERWGKHREVALENPTALSRAQQPSTKLARLEFVQAPARRVLLSSR